MEAENKELAKRLASLTTVRPSLATGSSRGDVICVLRAVAASGPVEQGGVARVCAHRNEKRSRGHTGGLRSDANTSRGEQRACLNLRVPPYPCPCTRLLTSAVCSWLVLCQRELASSREDLEKASAQVSIEIRARESVEEDIGSLRRAHAAEMERLQEDHEAELERLKQRMSAALANARQEVHSQTQQTQTAHQTQRRQRPRSDSYNGKRY